MSVAAAFMETGKEGKQTGLMEPQNTIFSWLTDAFLLVGQCDHLTVSERRERAWSL